ncbi:MAG: hypothetical protein ACREJC_15950 [Tepidisphaeraceae bacterium]
MAFYDRIVSDGGDNISVHAALACAREVVRGHMTAKDAYAALVLDSSEQAEFDDLCIRIKDAPDGAFVWDAFYLAKRKVAGYLTGADVEAKIKGKGVITV